MAGTDMALLSSVTHRPFALPLLVAAACNSGGGPAEPTTPTPTPTPVPVATPDTGSGSSSNAPAAPAVALPAQAPVVPAAELAGDHACGRFSSSSFAATDVALLGDRMRVRFLPSPVVEGDTSSVRAAVTRNDATIFVGARELYMQGDADFLRHATRNAAFDGAYDPVTVPGRDGTPIVAGLLKAAPATAELVAVAHGWFLDGNRDVLDIAVFASGVTAGNLAECRKLAQKVLATAVAGPRKLAYGGGAVETKVSYATFRYTLPPDWILASSSGIHDFARISFRRRGSYPDGFTELQLALDSHPGEWTSPGDPDGTRTGKLFGLDVTWTKTRTPKLAGAWTISSDVRRRDHAVGSIASGSAAGRDAAIVFAESIVAE